VKLTDAQRVNLDAIRKVGGSVEHDRYGFHRPGEKERLRGMNAVAVHSLAKLGLLTVAASVDRDTFTLVERKSRTPGYSNFGGGGPFAAMGSPSRPSIVRACMHCNRQIELVYDTQRKYRRAICACGAHCTTD
jgi:hypothetical protein